MGVRTAESFNGHLRNAYLNKMPFILVAQPRPILSAKNAVRARLHDPPAPASAASAAVYLMPSASAKALA